MAIAGLSRQLADRAKRKDFERRILCHAGELLQAGLRFTRDLSQAETLVEETMLRAWYEFDQFGNQTSCKVWLFKNMLCLWNHDDRATSDVTCDGFQGKTGTSLPKLLQPTGSDDVRNAVNHLRDDLRVLLLLFSVDEFSCAEISEILTIPLDTVMSKLAFARDLVRSGLGAQPVLRASR
jgi:RNA polymerase sigma-70 factor (ECF subfamily)